MGCDVSVCVCLCISCRYFVITYISYKLKGIPIILQKKRNEKEVEVEVNIFCKFLVCQSGFNNSRGDSYKHTHIISWWWYMCLCVAVIKVTVNPVCKSKSFVYHMYYESKSSFPNVRFNMERRQLAWISLNIIRNDAPLSHCISEYRLRS